MMTPEIQFALSEIKESYPSSEIIVTDDGNGGASIIIEEVVFDSSSHPYCQNDSWVGFRIHFQYPDADVYPIFVRGNLKRKDGQPLGAATSETTFEKRSAIQLSRRSNNRNTELDTALIKIKKVIKWLLEK